MIKVSIVIPVYNVEAYLDMCMESVLSQTYENIEIILVDDGSKDSSPEICDRYVTADNRVKAIHQQNGGLSHARNTGIKHATGDYVFFLDSDDCINPELIERLAKVAKEKNAALVQCDIEEVPNDFNDFKKSLDKDCEIFEFDTKQAFYNIDRDDKSIAKDIRLITTVVWTKLYKKELLDKIQFPEDIKLHEDQMVAHRFIVEAGGLVFYKAPMYYYRKRPNSLITEGWTPKRLTIFECYKDRVMWAKKVDAELAYYIYIRYLTCMFKNYLMAKKKLTGEEQSNCCKHIITRYREELKTNEYKLRGKDKLMYKSFEYFPNAFVFIYRMLKG